MSQLGPEVLEPLRNALKTSFMTMFDQAKNGSPSAAVQYYNSLSAQDINTLFNNYFNLMINTFPAEAIKAMDGNFGKNMFRSIASNIPEKGKPIALEKSLDILQLDFYNNFSKIKMFSDEIGKLANKTVAPKDAEDALAELIKAKINGIKHAAGQKPIYPMISGQIFATNSNILNAVLGDKITKFTPEERSEFIRTYTNLVSSMLSQMSTNKPPFYIKKGDEKTIDGLVVQAICEVAAKLALNPVIQAMDNKNQQLYGFEMAKMVSEDKELTKDHKNVFEDKKLPQAKWIETRNKLVASMEKAHNALFTSADWKLAQTEKEFFSPDKMQRLPTDQLAYVERKPTKGGTTEKLQLSEQQLKDKIDSAIGPDGLQLDPVNDKHTINVYKELITTEAIYVKDLHLLDDATMDFLLSIYDAKPKITPKPNEMNKEELKAVFDKWKEIRSAQVNMLNALSQPNPEKWGIELNKLEKLYQDYNLLVSIKMAPAKIDNLTALGINFQNGTTDLKSMLIKPTQRITKYPLLAADLVRKVDVSHKQIIPLNAFSELTKVIVVGINTAKSKAEDAERLVQVRKLLNKNIPAAIDLMISAKFQPDVMNKLFSEVDFCELSAQELKALGAALEKVNINKATAKQNINDKKNAVSNLEKAIENTKISIAKKQQELSTLSESKVERRKELEDEIAQETKYANKDLPAEIASVKKDQIGFENSLLALEALATTLSNKVNEDKILKKIDKALTAQMKTEKKVIDPKRIERGHLFSDKVQVLSQIHEALKAQRTQGQPIDFYAAVNIILSKMTSAADKKKFADIVTDIVNNSKNLTQLVGGISLLVPNSESVQTTPPPNKTTSKTIPPSLASSQYVPMPPLSPTSTSPATTPTKIVSSVPEPELPQPPMPNYPAPQPPSKSSTPKPVTNDMLEAAQRFLEGKQVKIFVHKKNIQNLKGVFHNHHGKRTVDIMRDEQGQYTAVIKHKGNPGKTKVDPVTIKLDDELIGKMAKMQKRIDAKPSLNTIKITPPAEPTSKVLHKSSTSSESRQRNRAKVFDGLAKSTQTSSTSSVHNSSPHNSDRRHSITTAAALHAEQTNVQYYPSAPKSVKPELSNTSSIKHRPGRGNTGH